MARQSGEIGTLISIWRYPVKSMMGEELNATFVGERGILGDRARAMIDSSDGKVASVKILASGRTCSTFEPNTSRLRPPERICLRFGSLYQMERNSEATATKSTRY